MKWYIKCFKLYATFKGRASRKEYWMFFLFNMIFSFIMGFLDGLTGWGIDGKFGVLTLVYAAIVYIPTLAVTVRRLHDIDKSGWNFFIGFIPVIGWIVLIVYLCMEGTVYVNTYGPQPQDEE